MVDNWSLLLITILNYAKMFLFGSRVCKKPSCSKICSEGVPTRWGVAGPILPPSAHRPLLPGQEGLPPSTAPFQGAQKTAGGRVNCWRSLPSPFNQQKTSAGSKALPWKKDLFCPQEASAGSHHRHYTDIIRLTGPVGVSAHTYLLEWFTKLEYLVLSYFDL